jgi:hypothetical protein
VPIIEDALTLAKTGRFKGAWEVEKALKHHGYAQDWIERHLSGRGMRSQITEACRDARKASVGSQANAMTATAKAKLSS